MTIGLQALKTWRARNSLDMRKKYPILFTDNIDKSCKFNPNRTYLQYPESEDMTIDETSPWYCFTLIPHKTVNDSDAFKSTLYILSFLNWAIYYYYDLIQVYKSIPKDPKQDSIEEAYKNNKVLAILIHDITGKECTLEDVEQHTHNTFKRNKFELKPSYFLKLCRFFLRGWIEEHFYAQDNTSIPVKFAYYASCYIEYCAMELLKRNYPDNQNWQNYNFTCKYKHDDENAKKEVAKLFQGQADNFSIQFKGFDIKLEKYLNPDHPQKKHTYTISISQYGCKYTFYLFARLYQHRYKTAIK